MHDLLSLTAGKVASLAEAACCAGPAISLLTEDHRIQVRIPTRPCAVMPSMRPSIGGIASHGLVHSRLFEVDNFASLAARPKLSPQHRLYLGRGGPRAVTTLLRSTSADWGRIGLRVETSINLEALALHVLCIDGFTLKPSHNTRHRLAQEVNV